MNSELYHYGVKGMKWGVRRYQNADGTLTQKGKARQVKLTKKAQKKWDKNTRKHWVEGYNKAADYSNNNFISIMRIRGMPKVSSEILIRTLIPRPV